MESHNQKFVVLTTQRSGSTWVVDMLASHPSIRAYTELFLANGSDVPDWSRVKDFKYWNTYRVEKERSSGTRFRSALLFEYMNECFSHDPGQSDATGFKLMYDQLRRFPEILAYLVINQVRIIHLYRNNAVAPVISNLLRSARKTAHVKNGEVIPEVRIEINAAEAKRQIVWFRNKVQRMRKLVTLLPVPKIEISYEELAVDRRKFQRVIEFIGVETFEVSSDLQKLSKRPIRESIANIQELREILPKGEFQSMLDEITAQKVIDQQSPNTSLST